MYSNFNGLVMSTTIFALALAVRQHDSLVFGISIGSSIFSFSSHCIFTFSDPMDLTNLRNDDILNYNRNTVYIIRQLQFVVGIGRYSKQTGHKHTNEMKNEKWEGQQGKKRLKKICTKHEARRFSYCSANLPFKMAKDKADDDNDNVNSKIKRENRMTRKKSEWTIPFIFGFYG